MSIVLPIPTTRHLLIKKSSEFHDGFAGGMSEAFLMRR
jgi:hypothetical protein